MKYTLLVTLLIGILSSLMARQGYPDAKTQEIGNSQKNSLLKENSSVTITVVGQGVAPSFSISPAQAYALAKRAAITDAYRLLAEKVKGVEVEGKDIIKNMIVQRSTVASHVQAMIKHATIVETTFKDGLCEVQMEVKLSYNQFK